MIISLFFSNFVEIIPFFGALYETGLFILCFHNTLFDYVS